MNINELDYFREIVESDFNLSKAAKKLHITQPTLSMMINNLEKEYSIKLFEKSKTRYIGLTEQGKYMYNHSLQILKIHNEFIFNLEQLKNNVHGTVKIGIPPLIISLLFSKCIISLASNNPKIEFKIIEQGANNLEELVLKNEIDFAVVIEPLTDDSIFNKKLLYKDKISVVAHKESKIAKEPFVTAKMLEREDLVLLDESFRLNTTLKNYFDSSKITPKVSFTTSQWDWLLDLVRENKSVTILPHIVKEKFNGQLITKDLDVPISWDVILISKKHAVKTPPVKFAENYIINYFR